MPPSTVLAGRWTLRGMLFPGACLAGDELAAQKDNL